MLREESWILLKSALKKQQHYFRNTAVCKVGNSMSQCTTQFAAARLLEVIPTRVLKHQNWKGPENQFNTILPFHRWGKSGPSDSVCPRSHGQTGMAVTRPTCPSHGPGIFVEEGDVCFPFSPLHLVDPASIIIIRTISQLHLIKHKHIAWHLGGS